jgi:adenine-specific DNA-methyltransferase
MPYYAGQVKCIYIDPPYNTQSAFAHYDDKLEHSQWLSMMTPRLMLLKDLLAQDGSIWVSIDDREAHYLKVLMDEIFGRENFIANVIWQKKYAGANDANYLSDIHDHVLVFAKNKAKWKPNLLERSEELNAKYSNPDNDPRGVWNSTNLSVKTFSEKNYYPIVGPTGVEFFPPPTRCWVVSREKYEELLADNRIWFGSKGDARPYKKTFLSEVQQGTVPLTLWLHSDAGHNIEAKGELRTLFDGSNDLFSTPKPERLIQRILHIATNPNDLVLDSFLGSGTTQR